MTRHTPSQAAHNETCLGLVVVPFVGAVLSLALMFPAAAVTGSGTSPVEHLVGKVADWSASEDRIDIYIERWSTDEELESIRAPLVQGDQPQVLARLRQQRRAGVVLMPGTQYGGKKGARALRKLLLARETVTAGGRQVIVVSDERFGLGESRAAASAFSMIDIRFDAGGTGVGKVAAATGVAFSKATNGLEVANYGARPPRLIEVRSEKP